MASRLNKEQRRDVFERMNSEEPFASYKKEILGQVLIRAWDSFQETGTEFIVKGDPRANDGNCIIDVFSEPEKVYFERMNRKLLADGSIRPYTRPENPKVEEKPMEQYTDEELIETINSRFFSLQAVVNNTKTTAVLFRMLNLAKDYDKSEKITSMIEARISEIQSEEYAPKEKKEE